MTNVLSGWKGIGIDRVSVSDMSAAGGGRVFRVASPDATPPVVVLRAAGEGSRRYSQSKYASLQNDRTQAAADLLSSLGLAPRQLAVGGAWKIEEFAGESVAEDFNHFDPTLAPLSELAKLMARFHSVPTEWFEPYREAMIARDPTLSPILRHLAADAPFWNGAAFGWENGMLFTGGDLTPIKAMTNGAIWEQLKSSGMLEELLKAEAFYPRSTAGRRVATIHGDFKPNNLVRGSGGCVCIDYDFTHVSPVQQELSFAYQKWLGPKFTEYEQRVWFLREYLWRTNQPSGDADMREFMIDIEIGTIYNFDGLLFSGLSRQVPLLRGQAHPTAGGQDDGRLGTGPSGKQILKLLGEFVERVRGSAELRQNVLHNGMIPTLIRYTDGPLRRWLEEMRLAGSLAGFGVYPNVDAWVDAVRDQRVLSSWVDPTW